MPLPRHPSWRRRSPRLAASARVFVVVAATAAATVGLSACRSIGPGSETAKDSGEGPGKVVAAATTPVRAPAAATTTPAVERTPPATTADAPQATDPVDATTVSGTTSPADDGGGPQPPKVIVDDPWQIVGRPFLLDVVGTDASATGITSYRLYFRTRGDFRGVRAGTAIDDPRHYKVGLIEVPELPAYVPGGNDFFALADRRKNDGRYCWAATLAKKGDPSATTFPIRGVGVALAVSFDLHRAAVQNRTAPVVIQGSPSALLPQEKALGCHIADFA